MSFISAAAPIKDKWIYLLIYAFVGYMFWAPAAHTFLLLSLHINSFVFIKDNSIKSRKSEWDEWRAGVKTYNHLLRNLSGTLNEGGRTHKSTHSHSLICSLCPQTPPFKASRKETIDFIHFIHSINFILLLSWMKDCLWWRGLVFSLGWLPAACSRL